MTFLSIKDQTFFYQLKGRGEPLVLVSGFTADHSVWNLVEEELSKQFTVLTFDNRGVGRSSSPHYPYTIERMAEDTLEIIQKIFGDRVNLVGHSMGGAIVQTIALQKPELVKKAVLVNTFPYLREAFRFVCQYKLDMYDRGVSRDLIEACDVPWAFADRFLRNNSINSKNVSELKKNAYPQSIEGYRAQLNALLNFNSLEWLKDITVPVGIIAGSEDIIATVEESKTLHRFIPGSELSIMKEVGHVAQIENPTEFLRILTHFLKKE